MKNLIIFFLGIMVNIPVNSEIMTNLEEVGKNKILGTL